MAETSKSEPAEKPAENAAKTALSGYKVEEKVHYGAYRDGYRQMLRIVQLQAVIIVLLVAAIAVSRLTIQPDFSYFASTRDGRIEPLTPIAPPPAE